MDHTGAEPSGPHVPPDEPWADWADTPAPTEPRSSARIWVPIAAVLVGLLCVTGTGFSLYHLLSDHRVVPVDTPHTRSAGSEPAGPASTPAAAGSAGVDASDYPVRNADDLGRVCDRWYYPQSPRFAGAAPHPIGVSVKSRMNSDIRTTASSIDVPDGVKQSFQDAWQPKDPTTTQLVACVDLVATGKSLGQCDFDDPKPDTVPMVQGIYQVTVYEVATRRAVASVRMTGDGKCPLVVLIYADRTIYSDASDRQLYEALHQYVEQ
jgi:hypothetical protein